MKKGERIKHLAEAILIFYWMLCLLRADSYYAPYLLVALAGIYCRIVRCVKHTGAEDGMTKGERWFTRVCAAAFSLTVTVANYRLYSYLDGTKLENLGKIVVGITLLLGGYILFHEILCGLYRHTDIVTERTAEKKHTPWLWVGMWVLIVAVDCFVLFAAEYPGVLTPDSISQMTQLLSGVYSNHHPYYHTQIIRACILAGLALFDDLNAAVALYSVFSVMVMATCFVYTVATIDTVTGRRKLTIVAFIWYLIMPFHIIYSISMWKDVFFGASMAGFVVSLYRCMNHIGRKTPNYIVLGITGLCVCLLRSNGWIAFIASTLVFLILFRAEYRKILFLFVGILAASFILKHPVLKALNVT